jgi:hypothetical protein
VHEFVVVGDPISDIRDPLVLLALVDEAVEPFPLKVILE